MEKWKTMFTNRTIKYFHIIVINRPEYNWLKMESWSLFALHKHNRKCRVSMNTKYDWQNNKVYLSVFSLLWGSATGLQHFLHKIESNTSFGLVFSNRNVVEEIEMTDVWCISIALLIWKPFISRRISVPGSDVFRLQVLQLRVNIVSITHVLFSNKNLLIRFNTKRNIITHYLLFKIF